MKPENADIRLKLRKAFEMWYEPTNDESSENCVVLKIEVTEAIVIKDHHAVTYYMDFMNKTDNITTRLR